MDGDNTFKFYASERQGIVRTADRAKEQKLKGEGKEARTLRTQRRKGQKIESKTEIKNI